MTQQQEMFRIRSQPPLHASVSQRRILDLLALLDGRPLTKSDHHYSRQALRRTIDKGFVSWVGPGTYIITPLGKAVRSIGRVK